MGKYLIHAVAAATATETKEHRVVRSDVLSCLTGPSERLTCACGWEGHSTMWGDAAHATRIPGVPIPPLPRVSAPRPVPRKVLMDAIYGERRDRGCRW